VRDASLIATRKKANGANEREERTMRFMKTALLGCAMVLTAGSAMGQAGKCRDPWVTEEVRNYQRRPPIGSADTAECNPRLYGSNWGSQSQLKGQVAQTFQFLKENGLEWRYEKVIGDLRFHTTIPARENDIYVGPRGQAPWADQQQTAGGGYFWHIPLPNDHVLIVARKCRRGWSSAGPGANSGCVQR
jgi:hypothetical protein